MAEDGKIKYSDIIQPDDAIEKLVKQLGELNKSYETMVNAIRAGADRITQALKTASGATNEGRKSIDAAAASTSRLERAQNELKIAMTDTGKQIAWLKAQTVDQNRATVEQQRYLQQAVTSYDRLKSDLKQTIEVYKSLTAAEREDSAMGKQLLQDILNLKNQIKALDDQMKPHIATLTEVQKAEQRLAYLQSEEGKKLLDLKRKIAELTSARAQQSASVDRITQAQQKLAYAQSSENAQLKLYSVQIQEANRIAQLQAQIANSAEGSYNRLSAQYALNKIRLNQMSQAQREAADSGKKLEAETLAIYKQMIKLQEATGNYRLSVGNYRKSWDGLGISISQVVRELPAAAVSLNTFFLGISNNVPMVIDEINRLRIQNKALAAEGKPTVSITKSITKAFLSWNTALVIVLTLLSMYGKQIGEWVKSTFKGRAAVISLREAISNVNKELETTNNSYGDTIVTLKQLQQEWKNLKTTAEKNQWITDNKTEFDNLGVAVNNVSDAENVFITNTDAVIEALRLRAKAAAAGKLASEQYEKALIARNKAETIEKDPAGSLSVWDVAWAGIGNYSLEGAAEDADKIIKNRIENYKAEGDAAEALADSYFDLKTGYESAADAILAAAGIGKPTKTTTTNGSKGRQPRDLTALINKNDIEYYKKYEESITKLTHDEYAKRRRELDLSVKSENQSLREKIRLNESYVANVDGKYKELTESQKKQLEQQNEWLNKTIENNLKALQLSLEQLQREQAAASLKLRRSTLTNVYAGTEMPQSGSTDTVVNSSVVVTRDASQMEASLVEERRLLEEALDIEYQLVRDTNARLREEGSDSARSEEEIQIELNKKKLELFAEYDRKILEARQRDVEAQLAIVRKGSEEELQLLLRQNEIARELAQVQNAAASPEEQVSSSVIDAQYNKSRQNTLADFRQSQLSEAQKTAQQLYNLQNRSAREIENFTLLAERERWDLQIELAKQGALEWSDAQIDAAEKTVAKMNSILSGRGVSEDASTSDAGTPNEGNITGGVNTAIANIAQYGAGGALLHSLGFDDEAIAAMGDATDTIVGYLGDILDAEVELAEAAVEAAEERVDAAKSAYDSEIEARNNGYANNVATAKKEYEEEKKNLAKTQKLQEEAQLRQQRLESAQQAMSLVTASANIWKSMSPLGIIGPALAAAAIAAMWSSFIASKIKAQQVSQATSEYGEGGLEFLEGGSHASGNDIDLGVNNKEGKRMKAEGGEALAIINRRETRRYKKLLPDIVESLNKGVFEDKFANSFNVVPTDIQLSANNPGFVDISGIERDLREIKRQNDTKYFVMPDGTMVIQKKNVKRIVKHRL